MNPVDPMDQVGAVLGIALLYFAFQAGLGIALALVFYGRVKQSWGLSLAYIATLTTVCAGLGYLLGGWEPALGVLIGSGAMLTLASLDGLGKWLRKPPQK